MYRFTTTWGIYFDIDMSRSEVSGHSRREARPSGCANMGELLRHRICPLARLLPIIYFELVIWVRIVTFQYGSRYGVGTALAYYLRPQTFWQEPCQVSGHSRREARPSGHLSPLAPDACPGTCVAPDALKPRKVPSVASERHCAPEHLARFLPSHLARFLPLQTPCRSLARFLPLQTPCQPPSLALWHDSCLCKRRADRWHDSCLCRSWKSKAGSRKPPLEPG